MGEITTSKSKRYVKLVIYSLLAGAITGVAGFSLVAMKAIGQTVAGGFIQGVCAAIITFFGLEMYNSHLCDVFKKDKKKEVFLNLFIIFILNMAMIVATTCLIRQIIGDRQDMIQAALDLSESREMQLLGSDAKEWIICLRNGLMCGLLVAAGSTVYKKCSYKIFGYACIIASVGIFVACGFENANTNASYIAYAHAWSAANTCGTLVALIGNVIGTYIIYYITTYLSKFSSDHNC